MQKAEKLANKSHKDRVQELNQYLEKLSEHYDIPKASFLFFKLLKCMIRLVLDSLDAKKMEYVCG